jgi:hypothetical protein
MRAELVAYEADDIQSNVIRQLSRQLMRVILRLLPSRGLAVLQFQRSSPRMSVYSQIP